MPKAMNYTKGSIIYFSGDKDDRIFILQKGSVILTSIDIETNVPLTEHIRQGEFFGVKSALGHFPREETATVVTESLVISLTVPEFEAMFSNNKQIILKMLRVFSNQLRNLHKKTESVLHSIEDISQEKGMLGVAQSFYDEESYKPCCDVCLKFLTRFPQSDLKETVATLYTASKKRLDLQASRKKTSQESFQQTNTDAALKQFSLPAFSRFAKKYEANTVIIAEFEPGDTFYLIQSGRVQLVKCVNAARKNLDILMPGEFFGEMAILENSPRSATCMSIEPVEVLEFNKENFEVLITGNPQIALVLLKLFCKRIYDQKRRLKTLVIHDTSARILDVFLMFDEMNPSPNMADRSRRFNLTLQDLSHWAGLPIEVVKEELSRFVEKRRIEIYDNHMIVANIVDIKRHVDSRAHQRH
ncbi:MAG TPA: Crp/Fnr family transcriptional regulator [Treponemataceae bacterium]|jgi:CRP-like cAMP-binding protein|nr:Crp/Fnr family transcriptional regulator [Treponemataceae bacterium]HQC27547.1 Crp/Fnr family transcriptional regulator [Treponemataceae bacterium]